MTDYFALLNEPRRPWLGFGISAPPCPALSCDASGRLPTGPGETGFRFDSRPGTDGLPSGEGVFLACSFWLANSLALVGRRDDAIALFERLLAVRNDLGLLSEEYDPKAKRLLGNFPQAFSHTAIINTAAHLAEIETASVDRGTAGDVEPARKSDG